MIATTTSKDRMILSALGEHFITGDENFLDVFDIVKDLKITIINVFLYICENYYVGIYETKKEVIWSTKLLLDIRWK